MRLNDLVASKLILALAATGLPLAAAPPSIAQAPARDTTRVPAYRLRLLGLFDQTTGEPIEGAEVFDVGSGWSAKTTATGTLSLVFLPDGGGLVRIRKVGYDPVFTRIAISPADTAPVTLLLARVTELPAVVTKDSVRHFISGKLNGFDERSKLKLSGYFITDTLLRKSEGRQLGNLLRSQFPGISIALKDGPFAATYYLGCVLLDGVPLIPAQSAAANGTGKVHKALQYFDLNSIDLSSLQGVEYYPRTGTAPPEFSGTGCSSPLLLWTRER